MKQFLDFLPLVLFFGAFKLYDLYVATAVLMAATTLQMLIIYILEGKLNTFQKILLAMVLIFGALTLYLHDLRFIKFKPVLYYAVSAAVLGIGLWGFKKNFLKLMLNTHFALPENIWNRLTVIWVVYSLTMAAVNTYAALNLTDEQWGNFKLWGFVFPFVFILGQGMYIAKYLQSPDDDGNESNP
jgi:intracellular septation protein